MTKYTRQVKPKKNRKIQNHTSVVDLFCGVGGLTHGLVKAGLSVKAGFDLDSSCKFAYEVNNKAKFICSDISHVRKNAITEHWNKNDIKILVGCAPCQPFSTHSNKINQKEKEKGNKWNLLVEFIRIIKEARPDIISMENVTNLSNKEIFKTFVDNLKKLKYHISYENIYCPDYGIPQKRRRLVLLASKFGPIEMITPTHQKNAYKTVFSTIGHLTPVQSGEKHPKDPLHVTTKLTDINLKRIKASVPNGTWEDWDKELRLKCHKRKSGKTYKAVYGRMSWDEPSPTITTQFYNYGTGRFGHPVQNRALTVREASLLQSFPHNYKFLEKGEEVHLKRIGTHIGNAVPVDLGFAIGKSILQHLTNVNNE
ncbi:MAG: DNA cytosine methyltransferase [Ferruginibacter sp.]